MFNHGITTSALFLLVGLVYERTHTLLIGDYGGLMKVMPLYTIGLAFFTLASMALPGTNARYACFNWPGPDRFQL